MNLAYNINGLRNLDVRTAILKLGNAGYNAVELSLHHRHIHPYFTSENQLRMLKILLKENGIRPICLATGAADLLTNIVHEPSLITLVAAGRDARIALIREAAHMAEELEIPVVNFSSGYKNPSLADTEAEKYLIDSIWKIALGSGKVTFAIEPEPGMFIETTSQAIALIKKAKVPNLKLNTDLGHVVCCEENIEESLKNALPFTVHMHVEDIKGRSHRHLIPGRGDIQWNRVIGCLMGEEYKGYLSVELYDYDSIADEAMKESRDFLLKVEKDYIEEK